MKRILCLLILVFAIAPAFAQVHQEIIRKHPDYSFRQIVQEVEKHFAGRDKGRGSGYKQFKRWEYFNRYRLDERGRLQNIPRRLLEEYTKYRDAYLPPDNLNFDCEWTVQGGYSYDRISSGHNGGLGRVNALVFDPADASIIYAGTPSGGLWRTTNGGGVWDPASAAVHWVPLTDGLPAIGVSGIAIDYSSPAGARTIYILTGDGDGSDTQSIGVLKSTDGGATWSLTGLNWSVTDFVVGFKLLIHPTNPNVLFAATNIGLFRTADGGLTWQQELNGLITDVEFRPGNPNTMYAVSTTTFSRSTDGGLNWTAINCGLTNVGTRMALAVTPADPDYVYIVSSGLNAGMPGTFRGLYRSTDGGDCFALRSNTPNILGDQTDGSGSRQQPFYDLAIAASTTDAEEVHVGGINSWRSLDGGQNWTITAEWNETSAGAGDYNHADVHALEYVGNTLYSGSDGGVYRTTNRADDWENISQGLVISQYYRIGVFSDAGVDYVMGGTQDNGLNQLRDLGAGYGVLEHWEGADGFECSPDIAGGYVYGTTQNGCLQRFSYPAGGVTWVSPNTPPFDSCGGAWLTPHTFDAGNSAILAGYTDIWRSTDDGGTWNNYSNGNIGLGLCDHIAIAPSNDDVVYVCKGAQLYRTVDDGANWVLISNGLPGFPISYFAIDPANSNRIWVTLSGFSNGQKVYFSPDGGANWQNVSGSLPNLPANTVVYEQGSSDGIYVGMDVGVYYRDNNLSDWILFSNGLPNVIISELDINYTTGKLFAGTYGRGIWCTDLFSACSKICLDCPVFNEIHSLDNTYSSRNCIYSTSWVYEETQVAYKAETFIKLEPRFYVDSDNGATFWGRIEPCNTGSKAQMLQYLAAYKGIAGYYLGPLQAIAETRPESKAGTGLNVFPNPSGGVLTVEIDLEQGGPLNLTLFNTLGERALALETNRPSPPGHFNQTYRIDDLPGGAYVLEMRVHGKTYYRTIVKLVAR